MLSGLHIIDTHKTGLVFEIQKAEDPSTGKKYAVKIMRVSSLGNRNHQRLAKNEWKAVKSLKHQNILSYYHFGKKNKRPYIVMEWVDAVNLKSYVASELPHGLTNMSRNKIFKKRQWAGTVVRQLLEVVMYIHRHNIIHCDLKPENILVADGDILKLIDFSYSKRTPFSLFSSTREISGTPSFISPEQIKKEKTTEESDIYSLGATIYYLLTGTPPYSGRNVQELLTKHLKAKHKPLYGHVPGVRKEFSTFVDRMLLTSKSQRLKNLATVRNDIIRNGIFPKLEGPL